LTKSLGAAARSHIESMDREAGIEGGAAETADINSASRTL